MSFIELRPPLLYVLGTPIGIPCVVMFESECYRVRLEINLYCILCPFPGCVPHFVFSIVAAPSGPGVPGGQWYGICTMKWVIQVKGHHKLVLFNRADRGNAIVPYTFLQFWRPEKGTNC